VPRGACRLGCAVKGHQEWTTGGQAKPQLAYCLQVGVCTGETGSEGTVGGGATSTLDKLIVERPWRFLKYVFLHTVEDGIELKIVLGHPTPARHYLAPHSQATLPKASPSTRFPPAHHFRYLPTPWTPLAFRLGSSLRGTLGSTLSISGGAAS